MNIIGDVEDKDCVIIDDLIDTAGTLCKGAKALREHGARKIIAYATHGVLSADAAENIENSVLDEVVVCDTIPVDLNKFKKVRTISIAQLLGETIRRLQMGLSVSSIYPGD